MRGEAEGLQELDDLDPVGGHLAKDLLQAHFAGDVGQAFHHQARHAPLAKLRRHVEAHPGQVSIRPFADVQRGIADHVVVDQRQQGKHPPQIIVLKPPLHDRRIGYPLAQETQVIA